MHVNITASTFNIYFQEGLLALHQEVQQVREASQEHLRAHVTLLQRRNCRRCGHRWRVQAPQQDRQV